MIGLIHRLVGAFLWCAEVGYDAKGWLRKQWRAHIVDDVPPHLDRCESCREINCDHTKVKDCAR